MSSLVTAFEAKTRLGRILDRVQAGEEITITRHGEPVAVLVPVRSGEGERAREALQTLRRIRQAVFDRGVRVPHKQVRAWINEGRP